MQDFGSHTSYSTEPLKTCIDSLPQATEHDTQLRLLSPLSPEVVEVEENKNGTDSGDETKGVVALPTTS